MLKHAGNESKNDRSGRKKERGGDIKKYPDTGEYYWDRIEVGTNDKIKMGAGENTVGVGHTHPPKSGDNGTRGIGNQRENDKANNSTLSNDDRRAAKKLNKNKKRTVDEEVDAYITGADGSVTKFTPEDGYREGTQIAPPGTVEYEEN